MVNDYIKTMCLTAKRHFAIKSPQSTVPHRDTLIPLSLPLLETVLKVLFPERDFKRISLLIWLFICARVAALISWVKFKAFIFHGNFVFGKESEVIGYQIQWIKWGRTQNDVCLCNVWWRRSGDETGEYLKEVTTAKDILPLTPLKTLP